MALHCETIEDVKARYKAGTPGRHFFDSDTLRFFAGRVAGVAYTGGGRSFFVTSEQFRPSHGRPAARRYSVRFQDHADPGDIHTLGGHKDGFQAFASYGAADRAAKRAALEAREFPAPATVAAILRELIREVHIRLPEHAQGDSTLDNIPAVQSARDVLRELDRREALARAEAKAKRAEVRADNRRRRAVESARRLAERREREAARVAAAYESGDVDSAVAIANRAEG